MYDVIIMNEVPGRQLCRDYVTQYVRTELCVVYFRLQGRMRDAAVVMNCQMKHTF
jgi:hypothetical protein